MGAGASPRNRSPRSPPGDTEPATHRLQDSRNGWPGPARPHPGSRTQTALRERMVENRGPGPRAGRCRARGACSPSGPRGAGSGRTPACRSRAERPHAPAHTRPRLSVHSLPRSRPRCRRPPGSRRAVRRLDPCVCCAVVAASAGDPAVVMRRNPQLTGLCGSSARHGGCDPRRRAVSALGAQRPDRSQFRRLTFQSRTPRMCGELVGGRAEAEGPVGSCPSGPGQQWGPQGGRRLQGSETPRGRTSRAISFPPHPPSRAASRLPRRSCRRHPGTPARVLRADAKGKKGTIPNGVESAGVSLPGPPGAERKAPAAQLTGAALLALERATEMGVSPVGTPRPHPKNAGERSNRPTSFPSNKHQAAQSRRGADRGIWRAFSPRGVKCSVKLLRGKIQVSLNLEDIVITEPELTAGDVLWDLIKARQEEQVIRTVQKNTSRGAE